EIVARAGLTAGRQDPLALLIGEGLHLNHDTCQRFAVFVKYTARNRACRDHLEVDIRQPLCGRKRNNGAGTVEGTLPELLTDITVTVHGDSVLTGIDAAENEMPAVVRDRHRVGRTGE